ncbi:M23 family metallopeptidase [Campylobacter sp. VicNov18]|uniref:M23 family metallopeptidase n=1 Tax=Campylobacter bilis TaxID=2691918 RepID=UPI00130E4A09|nr:M23 family metallopeptidase [Campylobacter bilis]MPV63143.1 peptidoglycan DD-metalloendopeptidase family protein [Campylobacter hepaticus]MBM0636643.1 peptidoglycan DD-metalloendopeptidase family protein [Campylobacter bilis]MCC8277487.1 M23 family metallopeptidase [Campylobacter bilis]MCC8298692.1 M23 family metallopeptidase [Campylobacter bilis]MCC8300396.1 M23 family metallopeptidase [Campylobacter bilis]
MKFFLVFLSFSLWLFGSQNLELIKGQTLILDFNKKDFIALKKNDQNIPTFTHPKNQEKILAIFALSYKNPPLNTKLIAFYKNKKEEILIKTLQGHYKSEKLNVENKKIFPPKTEQKRIAKEFQQANVIYNSYTPKALFDSTFNMPLNSAITSDFGKARTFNEKVASYHSGTDFKASINTPIYATNSGIVKIAKNRYFAGNSVVIDHGLGIYSQYYHLSKIIVKEGQKVKKGELLGLSGATGRVSGPHLHFGILAGGKQVDPLDFISKFNALFQ